MKILWLCPVLNHYKLRNLDYLDKNYDLNITILAGSGRSNEGDKEIKLSSTNLRIIKLDVLKKYFGINLKVYKVLFKKYKSYDWIHIPRERKFFPLILVQFFLIKLSRCDVKIFSYCHQRFNRSPRSVNFFNNLIINFFHLFYDKIIFYSKKSMESSIEQGLIHELKAGYADNTIYTKEIEKNFSFILPDSKEINLLFIGRLVMRKKIKLLFDYYYDIKSSMANYGKKITLSIIGDGPLKDVVVSYVEDDDDIKWEGAVVDESKISEIMSKANFVINLGASGLNIIHAFSYGRPFITLDSLGEHGPELNFLIDGYNGYLLKGDRKEHINKLTLILSDIMPELYKNAFKTSKKVNTDNWCKQIEIELKSA